MGSQRFSTILGWPGRHLGAMLGPFWPRNGPQLAADGPRIVKNRWEFIAFYENQAFGAQAADETELRPKTTPKRAQIRPQSGPLGAPKRGPKTRPVLRPTLAASGAVLGAIWGPFWGQNRVKKLVKFRIVFWPPFRPPGGALGPQGQKGKANCARPVGLELDKL